MTRLKLSFAALVIFVLQAGYINNVSAAQPPATNITVRPFLQELKINPNEATKELEVNISNDSAFTQDFHFSIINFGSLDQTGGVAFEGANVKSLTNKYGLAKWLSLDQNDIELGPGQQTAIKGTITNGPDLAPGAHYAAIVATASRPGQPAGQLTVTPKVSSLIFATKLGGEVYNLHLESVSHNGTLWRLPSTVTLGIRSTGNTYLVPRGIVSLVQNKTVLARGIINEQSSIVLPENVRNFDVNLNSLNKIHKSFFRTKYRLQVDYRYDGVSSYAAYGTDLNIYNRTSIVGLIILGLIIIVGLINRDRLWSVLIKRPSSPKQSRPKPKSTKPTPK